MKFGIKWVCKVGSAMRLGGVTAEESVDNTETGRGAELFDLSVF